MRKMFAIRHSVSVVTVFSFTHWFHPAAPNANKAAKPSSLPPNMFAATVRRLGELSFTIHLVAHGKWHFVDDS